MESAPTGMQPARAVIRRRDGWFILLTAIIGGPVVKWVIRETVERGDAHCRLALKIVHATNTPLDVPGAGSLRYDISSVWPPSSPFLQLVVAIRSCGLAAPWRRRQLIDRVSGEVVDFIKCRTSLRSTSRLRDHH
jgi:hypothetical protein